MFIMKIRSLFLTLFCTICFSVSGQVDAFQENIIEYLTLNGTQGQYSLAYSEMFDVLKQQFVNPEVPKEVWDEISGDREQSVSDVLKFLSFAYRKHFTEADIKQMSSFYQTETAQKMVARKEQLTQEENKEVTAFLESELGMKIKTKQAALSEDVSEISSHWSRDLFSEKMNTLIEKGYTPMQ